MPVSTSSSSSPRPARNYSGLVGRWNSTRDRIDAHRADERRRSVRDMQEGDDTGLYDRPDWPLPSPLVHVEDEDNATTPQVDSAKAFAPDGVADMEHEQLVNDDAVLRNPMEIGLSFDESTYLAHSDVSDIEEESEISGDEQEPGASWTLPHNNRNIDGERDEEARIPYRELVTPQRPVHAEVSPVRESDASRGRTQPVTEQLVQQQRQQDTVHVALNGREIEDVEENDPMEYRNIGTDLPPGQSSPNLHYEQQEQQVHPSTPALADGSMAWSPPRTNGDGYRSYSAKGPIVPMINRRASTRSSWINTTQIPHNKDRVRYSWQSLQDDEPNRPRIHIIKLVSNTATASAGFPTGEAFGFSISPGGRRIAAFNSARLYVLQTNALPVAITQDYALKRRPLDVELTDEANTMAILADDHTVNIYDLGLSMKRTRTIKLDFPTSCIALAPTGGLLAAAYEGGVEVFSLAAGAMDTDRRAVRSARMDRLSFSEDGSTLLGTTTRINVSATVVVSVPVFPAAADGVPSHEELKEAWCSELLHPENIRNSSHATFMREGRKTTNERVFAWNGLEDTFGILNVGDMHYGNIDFPVVISPPLSTCGGLGAAIHSCPAIDEHGDTVAMIVNDRTIRLYIVPQKVAEHATDVEAHSIDHELDEGYGCPFHEARWVYSSASLPAPATNQTGVKGRLIVTSPGGVTEAGMTEESVEDVEGGRIIMFDFDPQFAGQPGQTFSLTLGKSTPQALEEEQVNVAEQVALVRRRTVNQSKGLSQRPTQLGRAATTFGNKSLRSPNPTLNNNNNNIGPPRPNRMSMLSIGSMHSEATRSLPDLAEGNESAEGVLEAFEEPYVQGAPRSQASLQRAASNAQRHRFQTLEERQQEQISSDSHGHFLPLPEYTEEPNAPLPSRYRAMAGLDVPTVFNPNKSAALTPPPTSRAGSSSMAPHTAPPDVGEYFSADLAFQAANARAAAIRDTSVELERHPEPVISQSQATTPTLTSRSGIPTTAFAPPQRAANETLASINGPLNHDTYNSIAPSANGPYDMVEGYNGAESYHAAGTYPGNNAGNDPPSRAGKFDSVASLPRSLQRAYSNAISPMSGPPPSLIGDWRNVSPVVGFTPGNSHAGFADGNGQRPPQSSSGGSIQEEPWDMISPVTPSTRQGPTHGIPYRSSSSTLNPPDNMPVQRASSSAGSFTTTMGTSSAPSSAGGRRMPPHMHAFRQAAAAGNPSASLFPPNQQPDHVPLRQNTTKASTVAHRITGWHPPAPSAPSSTSPLRRTGSMRSRFSRKNSVAGKSAFANTARAKKLGFFKKSKKPDPFAPSSYKGQEGGSVMETKSMFTTFTRSDGKCSVM